MKKLHAILATLYALAAFPWGRAGKGTTQVASWCLRRAAWHFGLSR
ncbi:MAG TPA: hypothetical protein VNT30_09275 [Stellaceae bacterium]|nr:hypothetical protein [Stellaceae bacterium]